VFTLDLARAHIRELHRAAERSHRSALLDTHETTTSRLRRLAGRPARDR
jgi:hypothetical protein